MKTTELMIGDYITIAESLNDENGPLIFQVVALNCSCEGDALMLLKGEKGCDEMEIDDEWSGIPITPEILEKNGFYWGCTASEEDFCGAVGCGYPDSGWCFDEGAGEIKIIFPNETDGGLVRLDDQNFDRHLELVFVKPLMVHELQHAFRILGIEKEVVL